VPGSTTTTTTIAPTTGHTTTITKGVDANGNEITIKTFTAHSAFEDPTAPADVLPRESIEVRTLVFHNA
jgi:hypothetical protein